MPRKSIRLFIKRAIGKLLIAENQSYRFGILLDLFFKELVYRAMPAAGRDGL